MFEISHRRRDEYPAWRFVPINKGFLSAKLNKKHRQTHYRLRKRKKMRGFHGTVTALCCVVVVLGVFPLSLDAQAQQLDPSFYRNTCPRVHSIVREVVRNVSKKDPRMLASLIRLHFHDCFVQVHSYFLSFFFPPKPIFFSVFLCSQPTTI